MLNALPVKTALYCGDWNWRRRGGIWKAINRSQGSKCALCFFVLCAHICTCEPLPQKVCKLYCGPLPCLWSVPSWENSDKRAPAFLLMQGRLSQAELCGYHLHTAVLRLYFLSLASTPPHSFQHEALTPISGYVTVHAVLDNWTYLSNKRNTMLAF